MLRVSILSLRLLLHVPNLQRQNAQPVYGPCRTLRIQTSVGQHLYLTIQLAEIAVNLFHQIRTVLVRAVNAALDGQSLLGLYLRIADDVLQMPLYGVNPAFQIEAVLYAALFIRIVDRSIYVVLQVIVANRLREDFVCFFSECHIVYYSILPTKIRIIFDTSFINRNKLRKSAFLALFLMLFRQHKSGKRSNKQRRRCQLQRVNELIRRGYTL